MTYKLTTFTYLIFSLISAIAVFAPRAIAEDTPSKNAKYAQIEAVATSTKLAEILPPIKAKEITPILNPALVPVCSCESTGKPYNKPRQFEKDGSVVTGRVNRLDKGACQINLHYHQASAEKMGLNLFTEAGNITYANYLYSKQGLAPWKASSACWGSGVGTSSIR